MALHPTLLPPGVPDNDVEYLLHLFMPHLLNM